MKSISLNSDKFGALASSLCLAHCLITPFVFVAQSCSATCCDSAPEWWSYIDYFFLILSFIAVFQSTAVTSKKYMKPALWISWSALFLVVMNDKLDLVEISKYWLYTASLSMVVLHLYNLKFCRCKTDQCCIHNQE